MRRGCLRGVPWSALLGGTAVAAALLGAEVAWTGVPSGPVLFALGLALLGVASAFVLDEPAADAVEAVPATLRQRTLCRGLALAVPLGVGLAATWGRELRVSGTPGLGLALEVTGCVALGVTVAAMLRRRGLPTPGDLAAVCVGPVLLVCALGEPVGRWVLVFPLAEYSLWSRTVALWLLVIVGCVLLVALSTRDPLAGSARDGDQSGRSRAPTNWAL